MYSTCTIIVFAFVVTTQHALKNCTLLQLNELHNYYYRVGSYFKVSSFKS